MNSTGDNHVTNRVLAMGEELRGKLSTLGKMEQRTAEAFYEKGIMDEFKWPQTNETKDEAQDRRKRNSNRLATERKRNIRVNEDEEARQRRLSVDAESHRDALLNQDEESRQQKPSSVAETMRELRNNENGELR